MAQTGAILIHYRAHFIKRLRENAPVIHADFSGGRETLELRYETVSTIQDPLKSPKDLLPHLLEHQQAHRQAELDARQCLSGPHKDDLAVDINGVSAKTYGSQGQTRTAALSLKLAQREIFQEETGEWPVLLLDDVLSELDPRRQAFVLNRIQGGQIFITCCEEEKLEGLEGGKAFHVQGGKL
jgi:DNA replication and repair protein RecF